MDVQTLIDRRAKYLEAEAAVLKRQSYSISVEGGTRSMTFANLAEIRTAISDLNEQITQAQGLATRRRRVFYVRSR